MSKRAILYARVSTDDQADKGYSLPSQLDLCRKYAERLGYTVVAELMEDRSGATPIAERPEGKQLTAMLKARQADAVVVYQVDRLSRDIVNLLATVQMWIRAGIEVHTCDIGRIESELDIVLVIKGWQGSDERKKILERTMRGKRAKAESGKVVVCGHAPYGYAYLRDDKGKVLSFEVIEEEARIVRLINQWYVYGDENRNLLSATKIAARLSGMGVPTPGEARNGYHRKRGAGMWNVRGVLSILENEVYAGVWRFNWRMGKTKIKRPLEETYAVNVPPIIDRNTWLRAQAQRKHNREMSMRCAKHDYLLRGLIICGCGYKMIGTIPNHTRQYACNWLFNHHTGIEPRTCFEKNVPADTIEADVWREIEELFSDLDRLSNELKAAQQAELDQMQPEREELKAIEANIKQFERRATGMARTLHALADTDPEGIVAQSLKKEIDDMNALHREQVERRDQLIRELGDRVLADERITEITQYARDVQVGIQNTDYRTKRRMLESLGVRVTIKEGRYYLKCVLGTTDRVIRRLPRKNARENLVDQASC